MPRSVPARRLLLLLTATASIGSAGTLRGQDSLVVVPDVTRRTVEDARDLLRAAGLNLGALGEIGGRGVPGTVARQRPRAGARARPGDDVHLSLLRGRPAQMPAIQGLPLERARALLREAGLTPGDVVGDTSADAVVNGHSYRAGDRLRPGEIINLSLSAPAGRVASTVQDRPSSPPPTPPATTPDSRRREPARPTGPAGPRLDSAAVPDVRRLGLDQARAALRQAGFTAAIDAAFADSARWTVASQRPAPGARTLAGGAVRLVLEPPAAVAAAPSPAVPSPPPAVGGQEARRDGGGWGSASAGDRSRPLPWLLIAAVLLLLAAVARKAWRTRGRGSPSAIVAVSARLRADGAPRTALDGSPFAAPRLRLRLRSSVPAARVGAGSLFRAKGGAG